MERLLIVCEVFVLLAEKFFRRLLSEQLLCGALDGADGYTAVPTAGRGKRQYIDPRERLLRLVRGNVQPQRLGERGITDLEVHPAEIIFRRRCGRSQQQNDDK